MPTTHETLESSACKAMDHLSGEPLALAQRYADQQRWLAAWAVTQPSTERRHDLDPGVAGVDLQRNVGMHRQRAVQVVHPVVELDEELAKFGPHLRVGPQQIDALLQ